MPKVHETAGGKLMAKLMIQSSYSCVLQSTVACIHQINEAKKKLQLTHKLEELLLVDSRYVIKAVHLFSPPDNDAGKMIKNQKTSTYSQQVVKAKCIVNIKEN